MTIGERMLVYRAKHGLTQRQFAELLGEHANTIYKVENGVQLHRVNEIRIELKLTELEEKDDENS